MRVVSWNLNWWNRRPERVTRASVIASHDADIVLLQEVSGSIAKSLRESHSGPSVFSQELHAGATWRWMGCALLVRDGGRIIASGVVAGLPKPQRGLWARVELPTGQTLSAVSWHTPNAAGDGRVTKMAAYKTMSEWLVSEAHPLLVGADLNTWVDPIDLAAPDRADGFYEEHEFVGPAPKHGLVDAYRTILERDGSLDAMRADDHVGPLAVSYRLKDGSEHRMDRIFASPDLVPISGGYDFVGAESAGSDHALHWIDFE